MTKERICGRDSGRGGRLQVKRKVLWFYVRHPFHRNGSLWNGDCINWVTNITELLKLLYCCASFHTQQAPHMLQCSALCRFSVVFETRDPKNYVAILVTWRWTCGDLLMCWFPRSTTTRHMPGWCIIPGRGQLGGWWGPQVIRSDSSSIPCSNS